MDMGILFAYVFGGVLVVVALVLLAKPLKWFLKISLNSMFAALGLLLFNLIGSLFGITIGVNIITALTVGILGLPGLALILVLKTIFR